MLEANFHWYIDNKEELLKEYLGKVIVIKDKKVIGAYNSDTEAYKETIKSHEVGSFIIQRCIPGEDAYTQTFHTRAIF